MVGKRAGRDLRKAARLALAVLLGLTALLLAAGQRWPASASAAPHRAVPRGAVDLARLYWIFYKYDLDRIYADDPAVVRMLTAGQATYALERRATAHPLPDGVIPAGLFFGAASLQDAIERHAMIPGVRVVVDDPENWRVTPVRERQDPLRYLREFSRIAQAHGYRAISVPALDLVRARGTSCRQQAGLPMPQAYLACGIPAAAASAAIYVIQAASVERHLPALPALVRRGAALARRASPNVVVIATLSTDPGGRPVGYPGAAQGGPGDPALRRGIRAQRDPAHRPPAGHLPARAELRSRSRRSHQLTEPVHGLRAR